MFDNLRYKMDVKKVKSYFETSMLIDAIHVPTVAHWIYQKPTRMLKAYTKGNTFWFSIHTLNGSFWEYTNYRYDTTNGNHTVARTGKYPAEFKHTR